MPAVWTGRLCFSTLNISIKLYPIIQQRTPLLHEIHASCHRRVKTRKKCPVHGVIPNHEVVSGYELESGQYIAIDRRELNDIQPRTGHCIDIRQFVSKSCFEPTDFIKSYSLLTKPSHRERYNLFRESLRRTNLYGIGKIFIDHREGLAAIWVKSRHLVLSTLQVTATLSNGLPSIDHHEFDKNREKIDHLEQQIMRHFRSVDLPVHEDRYQERLVDLIGRKVVRYVSGDELGFTNSPNFPYLHQS